MDELLLSQYASAGLAVLSEIRAAGERRAHRELVAFVDDLEDRIQRIERAIDSEEFAVRVNRALFAIAADSTEVKRMIFASILGAAYTGRIDLNRSDIFTALVERFVPAHFDVISLVSRSKGDDFGPRQGPIVPYCSFKLVKDGLGAEDDEGTGYAVALLFDLVNAGLLATRMQVQHQGKVMFNINPAGLLTMQSFGLTDFGRAFAQHVCEVTEPQEPEAKP